MLEIIYYVDTITGESQIRETLLSIKKESTRAKISATIVHVAENDGNTQAITTKTIRGFHFSEIRIKISHNLYRILYFVWEKEKLVLLHIFLKKEGEKTPQKELWIAEEKYNDFMNNLDIYE